MRVWRFVGRHGIYSIFYLIMGERHLQIGEIMLIVAKGLPVYGGSSRDRGADVVCKITLYHLFYGAIFSVAERRNEIL